MAKIQKWSAKINLSSYTTGIIAETHAEIFLKKQGLTTITRRYLSKTGEIDLIMDDNSYLVFIEVRYRRKQNYGNGLASITPIKLRKIIKTSQYFCNSNNILQRNMRIDIVSISGSIITPNITWIKNINS